MIISSFLVFPFKGKENIATAYLQSIPRAEVTLSESDHRIMVLVTECHNKEEVDSLIWTLNGHEAIDHIALVATYND